MSRKTSLFCALLLCAISSAAAYNYLMILHTAARSHYNVGCALAKGLANAGHRVTVISPFSPKKPIARITDIDVPGIIAAMGNDVEGLLDTAKKPIIQQIVEFHAMGLKVTRTVLDDPNVQALIHSNQTFDGIIAEVFLNEAHFGFAEHFKAPLIGLGPFGAISWNTDLVGTPSPPSYVPHGMLKFGDHMNLFQRIANLAFLTYERIYLDFFYLPHQEEIHKHYFPHNKQTMAEARRNAALVLLNQHVSLSFPRPYSPNMIEVGGMHINRKRTPLPADIEKFINDAKHGVIYFSMGSNLKSKNLPADKLQAFLNTFRGIKQHVLWKFEDNNLPNKPDNVFISAWYPQDDILAHEKVVAFITHGGLLSTTESIYHGKPVIGIPIFADQFLNMARAEQHDYGLTVFYNELSPEKLTAAIKRVTSEPKFTQMAQAMSRRFRDQKETPLERAVFWIEHISRHKGAKYLRSASQDLNFVQYHNLDAIFILYGGILFVLYAIFWLLRFVVRRFLSLFTKKPTKTDKKVKRN